MLKNEASVSQETTNSNKAISWLRSVKASLQRNADDAAAAGYLASTDLSSTPASDRHIPKGTIDKGDERFLERLESTAWNEHAQGLFAALENRRVDFLEQHPGADIGVEQFVALRTYLDRSE